MKVIKNGKLAKQVTCSYCGCVYEFEGIDVKIEYNHAASYLQPSCYINIERKYVRCPQCGEKHHLKNPNEVKR